MRLLISTLAAVLLWSGTVGAAPQSVDPPKRDAPETSRSSSTVSLRLENDIVAGTDREYSSGFSLAYSHDGRGLLGGVWRLFGAGAARTASSYELAQEIYTPADISLTVPDSSDRPYAGLLFGAVTTLRVDRNRLDGFKLLAGVVGPASLAEPIQHLIHRVTRSKPVFGWSAQLQNELLLNAFYEQRRRYTLFADEAGWTMQAIPAVGAAVGNLLIQGNAEAQLRIGRRIPDEFGTSPSRSLGNTPLPPSLTTSRPSRGSSYYAFVRGAAYLVAHNLTLDGNTFEDGPRVAKRPLVPCAEAGVSVARGSLAVSISLVLSAREHEGQYRRGRYGTTTIGYSF